MDVFRRNANMRARLDAERTSGKRIGFVPTMGALHDGHLSLLEQAKRQCEISVVSIFVNPTQFNDPGDLAKYPRPVENDIQMLYESGCDIVYLPLADEVYPAGLETRINIDFDGLTNNMEGQFRPGHFDGVAQVVNRLLQVVEPDALYMGQKDFQQTAVVRHLIETLSIPVELVICPTLREPDGLAMSSRNVLLEPSIRERSSIIYRTLLYAANALPTESPGTIRQEALRRLSAEGFQPEYFEIVDGYTLQPVSSPTDSDFIVACAAVKAGDVRLIDNLILKQPLQTVSG